MNASSPAARIAIAGVPLLVIAIVFGALGYAIKTPAPAPIPALEQTSLDTGARGEIAAIENREIVLVTDAGERLTYTLAPDATIEALTSITLTEIALGDWLNGGAIPHAQTVLALTGLVLISEPETP